MATRKTIDVSRAWLEPSIAPGMYCVRVDGQDYIAAAESLAPVIFGAWRGAR